MSEGTKARILVVEDEARLLEALVKALGSMGHEARGESDPVRALDLVTSWSPDAVITDLKMPGMDGVEFSERALALDPDLPVIILTGFGTIRSAVEAVRRGVFDYLAKPFDLDQVELTLGKALERRSLARRTRVLEEALAVPRAATGIVGASAAIRRVLDAVEAVADTDSTVLVTGESGTGKELVARAVHSAGARSAKPFTTVDCAALPAPLIEDELFGHARGAFTGAHTERAGYFEVASDGTVFLDEVGELDLPTQRKLLRVIEDKTFVRLGETRRRNTGARVVAATNRDLAEAVEAGRFRQDLYYRLRVIEIRTPPLRERVEDIALLVDHFVDALNRKLHRRVEAVSPAALEALRAYRWPGNVRELANVLEQALTFHAPTVLDLEHLPGPIRETAPRALPSLTYPELKEQVVETASRTYLESLLLHFHGNVSRVADRAGIDRRHIHRLLQKLGIDPDSYRDR
ncbi:MAG: sigma-54-dependent Fis family transcriptional regulator [Deltaproteobacteria bacterium]|nr:sigma-54-dependent Fis family transcriptional regulator [Deltaproteobacteria bacterium]